VVTFGLTSIYLIFGLILYVKSKGVKAAASSSVANNYYSHRNIFIQVFTVQN
jgi:hypothetical protein